MDANETLMASRWREVVENDHLGAALVEAIEALEFREKLMKEGDVSWEALWGVPGVAESRLAQVRLAKSALLHFKKIRDGDAPREHW